jgi:4-amino-4-deoxy-L-arabinose transferase-like glycosyltransferase
MSLALALVVFLWVRDIAGFRAGLFASFMYSLCPTIIAHSSLVTPDIGVSLFMSAAVYVLWKYVKRPSAFRLALSGIALGLAFLSKFNALVLVPAYCVLLYVSKAGRFRVKCIQTFRSILVMVLIAFFVLWSGYFFEFGPLLRHGGTHNAFELLTQSWPKAVREKALFFGERFSLPLPSYISGLFWHSIVVPTKIGRDSFLLGAAMRRSPWYGDIFAFTVKTPIPFLVFMLIGLYQFIKRRRYQTLDYSFPLVPAAMVLLGDSVSRLSVQLKYILPAYPFLIVFMGTTFEWGAMKNALYRALFIVLCLWYAVCALSIFPHYLAYFNELAGGPQNGYRYLVDSNLDWGQDLKLLKNYIDTKKIQTITLAYFGTADPAYYGISYTKLEPFKAASGWIAVSATLLQGVHAPRGSYEWLKQYKPEAKIGYSIFVYKISS